MAQSPILTVDGIELYEIPGHPNYCVSKCGKVWSRDRFIGNGSRGFRVRDGGWRIPQKAGKGYHQLFLGRGNPEYVHRLVAITFLGLTSEWVDHIDGNPTNNDMSNLRLCSNSTNQRNSRKRRKAGFKGVTWDRAREKWLAAIVVNGKRLFLGRFEMELEGAFAYDAAAQKHFGEFAKLNFA